MALITGGHHVGRYWYDFPHICPGLGCAIAAWLKTKHMRLYSLK